MNKVLILWFSLTALMCLAKNSIVRADDIFLREYWMSISGNSVSDLTSDPKLSLQSNPAFAEHKFRSD